MTLPEHDDVLLILNPGCSKCRALDAELDQRKVAATRREYLVDALDADELREVIARLGGDASAVVRWKDVAKFENVELTREATESEIIDALVAHPALLERPILVRGNRARVGRPIELALELLE